MASCAPLKTKPSGLPPRYQIKRITTKEAAWARAILCHTNIFFSPAWATIYPENQTARCYDAYKAFDAFVGHSVASGLSFGVFDKEYAYKYSDSEKAGGKLFWNLEDTSASGDKLLELMDFPLVSVAMSWDHFEPLAMEHIMPVMAVLPEFGIMHTEMGEQVKNSQDLWFEPKAKGQVIWRAGTSTRHEYEGKGLMKILAWFVMRELQAEGVQAISIDCMHDAVIHTWMNPPSPFKASRIASIDSTKYEQEVGGKMIKPFAPSKQMSARIFVTL